ncbi:MAG: divalent metal cation transporter [Bacteriovorax sp.]|nr:divalent metal cation transporter [Bacteriovorax sp.]
MNLDLNSSLITTRSTENSKIAQKIYHEILFDNTFSLFSRHFYNSSILILSEPVFYNHGFRNIIEIQKSHKLLAPLLGVRLTGIYFALALFAAGQVVLEGI